MRAFLDWSSLLNKIAAMEPRVAPEAVESSRLVERKRAARVEPGEKGSVGACS
jgi:hypothetical protein